MLVSVIPMSAVALVLGSALLWRHVARRRRLPCPTWLGWILENPYMNAFAGSTMLLDRAEVGPGMRVLDAGSGPGRLTIPAAERVGPSGEVVALDVQDGMLARVRRRAADRGLANVRAVLGDIESSVGRTDIGGGRFDRALLVAVLGEIPDQEGAMRALEAALSLGGLLSVTEVIPDPHFETRDTVRRLAEGAGLRFDGTHATPLAFTMNFRKPA
jgi:ubiquinone/menaquinone biosynthesis C-methylase UbiE